MAELKNAFGIDWTEAIGQAIDDGKNLNQIAQALQAPLGPDSGLGVSGRQYPYFSFGNGRLVATVDGGSQLNEYEFYQPDGTVSVLVY